MLLPKYLRFEAQSVFIEHRLCFTKMTIDIPVGKHECSFASNVFYLNKPILNYMRIYCILILLLIHAIPLVLVNVFYNMWVILLILSLFLHAWMAILLLKLTFVSFSHLMENVSTDLLLWNHFIPPMLVWIFDQDLQC